MKRSTAAISSAVLLLRSSVTDAFGFRPPSHHATTSTAPRRHHHRTTTRRSRRARATTSAAGSTATIVARLDLFDPNAIDAAMMTMDYQHVVSEPSILLASSEFADVIGQLALLGSVGFGMAYSRANDPDWHYEYRTGNDYAAARGAGDGTSDVALLEVSPMSVLEKVEGSSMVADVEPTIVESVPDVPDVVVVESPPVVDDPVRPPPIVPKPAKAIVPSEGILKSAERAKEVVQRVGVQETKDRMNSKGGASSSSSAAAAVESTSASTPPPEKIEVAVTVDKRDDGGKRIVKGLALIVTAGVVALVRNVVKAYLGKGML